MKCRGKKLRVGNPNPVWCAQDVRSFPESGRLTEDQVARIVASANATRETSWKQLREMAKEARP